MKKYGKKCSRDLATVQGGEIAGDSQPSLVFQAPDLGT